MTNQNRDHFSRPVQLATAFDDGYAPIFSVLLESLKLNCDKDTPYELSCLVGNINQEHVDLLMSQSFNSNIKLTFINCSHLSESKNKTTASEFPAPAFYRLNLARILTEYDTVLYLDPDIVINNDIYDIHTADITGKYAAVVRDVRMSVLLNNVWDIGEVFDNISLEEYFTHHVGLRPGSLGAIFNSGVMLLNLSMMRENNITDRLVSLSNNHVFIWADQDILNLAFEGEVNYVDQKFNFIPFGKAIESQLPPGSLHAHGVARRNPSIIHFAGREIKPWRNKYVEFSSLFWRLAKETPFYSNLLSMIENDFT